MEVQDFIEKFYPDYSHDNTIAVWNDYEVLISGEFEEDSAANKLLKDHYDGDTDHPCLRVDKVRWDYDVLTVAVEALDVKTFVEGLQNDKDKLKEIIRLASDLL